MDDVDDHFFFSCSGDKSMSIRRMCPYGWKMNGSHPFVVITHRISEWIILIHSMRTI